MTLGIKAVCVADHNKGVCGLSFGLTLNDQVANETVHSGSLQLARVFCKRDQDFSQAFPRECPIIEHSETFDSLIAARVESRLLPRRIRIFNAFPVGFIYSRLMDGAEAP
jgi:hypothetical protein